MIKKADGQFKFYVALGIVFILGLSVIYLLRDYLIEFFYAVILAFLVYPAYTWILEKTNGKQVLSASVVLIALFLLVLIPLMLLGGVLVNYLSGVEFSDANFESYEKAIYDLTGVEVSISESLGDFWSLIVSDVKDIFPRVLSLTSNFLLSAFIVFFLIFYMLIEKEKFLKFVFLVLPFSTKNSNHLLDEGGRVVKAVLIGQVLTAIIQGSVGMFSFFVAGVSGAFFWGLIMIVLSVIPLIGAFLVWIPVGLFLIFEGNVWQGVFVLVWGAVVVSQVDNIIRPMLVQRFANIHPIETLLGIFGGISVFGLIGIIIGPLLIAIFSIVVKFFYIEYGREEK